MALARSPLGVLDPVAAKKLAAADPAAAEFAGHLDDGRASSLLGRFAGGVLRVRLRTELELTQRCDHIGFSRPSGSTASGDGELELERVAVTRVERLDALKRQHSLEPVDHLSGL